MRKTIKRTGFIAVSALALTSVGVAYAYWTTTGSGSGSATAGADVAGDAIQLTQTIPITGLYPDAPAQDIVVKAVNPAAFDQEVGEVTVTVTYPADCDSTNWALTQATNEFGLLQANNAGSTDEATAVVGTFRLIDTGLNQDLCKTDVPTFAFASASGA